MPINFGLLNTQPVQPHTEVVSMPNTQLANEKMMMDGINSGVNNYTQMQQNKRAQALLPGQLEGQQLSNQSQGLLNKEQSLKLQQEQFKDQAYHNQISAYATGKEKGGSEAGLDAMQDEIMKTDPNAALQLSDNRQKLKQNIADGNIKAVTTEAAIVHGVMSSENPLQTYTEQYRTLKRISPDAPDPKSFKNNNDFTNTYAIPTMETAYPYTKQLAMENELNKTNNLLKGQNLVDQRKAEFKSIINNPRATAEERKDAATQLQQAQDEVSGQVYGKGITGTISQAGHAAGNWISDKLGLGDSDSPSAPAQAQAPGQQAQPTPMPTFNNKEEFQNWYSKQPAQVQQSVQAQLNKGQ